MRQAAPQAAADADADALWRFSLALYARPGVADALIALQDRAGRDVNLILYALWQGTRGIRLDADEFAAAAAAIAPLNAATTAPLRRLRQQLRGNPDPGLAMLRRRILGLELAAERLVQSRLAADERADPRHRHDGVNLAAANLALYVGDAPAPDEAALLLAALRRLARR